TPRSRFQLACLIVLWTTLAVPTGMVGQQPSPSPVGTFRGTLTSRYHGAFPVSIDISEKGKGKFHGIAALTAKCFAGNATFQVTVSGTSITIAGSDAAGDNITVKGQIDPTTLRLTLSYIANGSASGRCVTAHAWGMRAKREVGP